MNNKKLNIFNLSYSTDAIDLFGGFKPINDEMFVKSIIYELEIFMQKYYDLEKNHQFFTTLNHLFS